MTLKKIFIILLITSVVVLTLQGRDRSDSTGKSFLWEVESAAGKSYLLGSIHLLKKEHYPLRNIIEQAFERTDVLAVEADISGDKMFQEGMKMMQKGMYTGEETLQKNISPKTFQLARDKMKELGMDIDAFKTFKPWMLALTIESMEVMKMGFDPNFGIDKYFMDKAVGKKEIVELEGIGFQVELFDGFSKEENEKFLLSSIMEASRMKKEMNEMVDAWANGDTLKMERFLTENIGKYPELKGMYEKILDGRNERMVEKIAVYLKTGKRYFIVVGAAHMVGEKGIVRLLQKKGIPVKQL
jgi:uncharacterized protein YbaP (TraB family)